LEIHYALRTLFVVFAVAGTTMDAKRL
jgi:hypothetical protein